MLQLPGVKWRKGSIVAGFFFVPDGNIEAWFSYMYMLSIKAYTKAYTAQSKPKAPISRNQQNPNDCSIVFKLQTW